MENKYYTPDISEFHVGFEYYEKILDNYFIKIYGTNKDVPLLESDESLFYSIEEELNEGNVCCKYLDKEDIESFGFTQVTNGYPTGFENEKYWINFREIDGLPNLCIYEKLGRFRLFSGTIKNKSELKVLFKQLNIIK